MMQITQKFRGLSIPFTVHSEEKILMERIQPLGTLENESRNESARKGVNRKNLNRKRNYTERRDSAFDQAFPSCRIMVVDDEPDIVSVLKKGLERKGFNVVGYTNPVEALSNFSRHHYDIVLTDIRMPQMNGIDLFRRLREVDAEVLICFVTAFEQFRRDFEIAYPEEQEGCFIPKPISIDGLAGMIKRKIEERESRWRKRV